MRTSVCLGIILALLVSLMSLSALAAGITVSSIQADKAAAQPGDTVTWTASAEGGSGTLRYCFYVYKGSAVVKKGSYSTAKTFSFAPTEAGIYKAKVFVKDASGTIVTRVSGNTTVSLPLKIGSVKANRTSAQTGTSITWTASASGGCGTLRYCFYVYKDGAVIIKGAYSTAKTYTYTPMDAGTYTAKVFVKDDTGTIVRKMGTGVAVNGGLPVVDSIAADKASAVPGDTITWTASASGGSGALKYCFYIYRDGTIVRKGSYSAAKTTEYTAETAGTYTAKVFVKDGAGKIASKTSGSTGVYTPLDIHEINCLNDLVPEWSYISWDVEVLGGSGVFLYNYYVYKSGISSVVEKSGWMNSASYSYLAETNGDYRVKVFVKDVRTGEVVSQLCTDFSIVEPAEYWDFFPLEIHDVITCGELFGAPAEIGWTVDASGGMGPLKYRYRVFQSGVSAPVEESDWIDSDTYTYHNAGEGYYTVEVTVKDKNGKGESVSMTCGSWITVEPEEYWD